MTEEAVVRNRIRELRGLRGLTLANVASRLGVTERTVSQWEAESVDIPSTHWEQLGQLFRVQPCWVLGTEAS